MRRTLALLLALSPGAALAHPLDEVVQGAYLTLAPGEVRLELDLTPGPLVAAGMVGALDANGDKRITEAEAQAFAGAVLKQSTLTVDGAATAWRIEKVSAPSYQSLMSEAATFKIYATAPRTDRTGAHVLAYENRYQPAKSQPIANVFLQPASGWQYQVTGQQHGGDGRLLTVSYAARR